MMAPGKSAHRRAAELKAQKNRAACRGDAGEVARLQREIDVEREAASLARVVSWQGPRH